MKRVLFMALLLVVGVISTQAQFLKEFTNPVPRPTKNLNAFYRAMLDSTTTVTATENLIRPIASIAAYVEPGNILMAGAGLGYQHLVYDNANARYNCQWSVNVLGFAGGSVAPASPASVVSVGVLAGVLNNTVMAGPVYNFGLKQFGVGLSIGINFNN